MTYILEAFKSIWMKDVKLHVHSGLRWFLEAIATITLAFYDISKDALT